MSYESDTPEPQQPENDPLGGSDTMAPPPPPPASAPPARRLVRDPYTRLGGVASGIGHHYGIDVSVVRIIFVLATLASGIGLLVYLLAWLVIPRADYWPPVGPAQPLRSLTGRDLGLGLALVGLMVALGFGAAGATGSILIPLVLVGGGVWLLVQPPTATEATPAPPVGPEGDAVYGSPPPPSATYAAAMPTGPAPAPVPPRSRKRVVTLIGIVALALLTIVAIPVLLVVAVVAGIASGNVSVETSTVDITPLSLADIPNVIREEAADVEIDLTRLDAADFADRTAPLPIDAEVDFGQITVIVPEDLDVSVTARSDLGEVTVFDETDDGFGNTVRETVTDPDVTLDLDMNVGEIVVERG